MSKSKYNNDQKLLVLENKIDRELAKYKKSIKGEITEIYDFDCFGELVKICEVDKWINELKSIRQVKELDCAYLLNESKKRKASKVRKKVQELVLSDNAVFITLTFTNETLEKTSAETRRRYVARYLKANSKKYVANIDFGGKNGREHYHAIVEGNIDFSKWYDYGAIDAEKIRSNEKDLVKTSYYVSKLSNHALKVPGITPRLIYSRK